MIHASKKYNEGHMGTIPEDEPVFLLRAQDETAAATVQFWLSQQPRFNPIFAEVEAHIKLMKKWPAKGPNPENPMCVFPGRSTVPAQELQAGRDVH